MPNIEFLTEKRFTLSSHLIEVALKNNLSLIEFLLLMYFEDTDDKTLNVSKISKVLSLKEEQVLQAFNHLITLNFIEVDTGKDEKNKRCETISLTHFMNLYGRKWKRKKKLKRKKLFLILFKKN